jgi:hypothetical protein
VLPDVQHPTRPNLDVFPAKPRLLLVHVFHSFCLKSDIRVK